MAAYGQKFTENGVVMSKDVTPKLMASKLNFRRFEY